MFSSKYKLPKKMLLSGITASGQIVNIACFFSKSQQFRHVEFVTGNRRRVSILKKISFKFLNQYIKDITSVTTNKK